MHLHLRQVVARKISRTTCEYNLIIGGSYYRTSHFRKAFGFANTDFWREWGTGNYVPAYLYQLCVAGGYIIDMRLRVFENSSCQV
jgi:hypothetical protein